MLAIKKSPADHDTQAYSGVQRCDIFWFNLFIMVGILWVYQTQGLFILCAPDTDITEDSHGDCSWTVGHKKLNTGLLRGIFLIYILRNRHHFHSRIFCSKESIFFSSFFFPYKWSVLILMISIRMNSGSTWKYKSYFAVIAVLYPTRDIFQFRNT